MTKQKRSAEQQVADEADRKAQNPIGARQTIADSHADPEFQETISVSGRSGGARCPADEQELTQLSKSVWIEGDKAGW
jgi:hypothetical protein